MKVWGILFLIGLAAAVTPGTKNKISKANAMVRENTPGLFDGEGGSASLASLEAGPTLTDGGSPVDASVHARKASHHASTTRAIISSDDKPVDTTSAVVAADKAAQDAQDNVVVPTLHGAILPGMTCRPDSLPAVTFLQCGDVVTIRVKKMHILIGTTSLVELSNSTQTCSPEGLFKMHCASRTDGAKAQYGERVYFRHVATGRMLEDGGDVESNYDHKTILVKTALVLSAGVQTEAKRHNLFTIFSPNGINVRGPVSPNSSVLFRNRFARYLKAEGKSVVTDIFDMSDSPDEGLFHLVTEVGPDNGCADGTREGFLDINRFPNIAGCSATWKNSLMMCPDGNIGSSNGLFGCSACSAGWHVCGWKAGVPEMKSEHCEANLGGFDAGEVARHTCLDDCRSQPGWFASAAPFAAKSNDCSLSGVGPSESVNATEAANPVLGCGSLSGDYATDTGIVGADCSSFLELKGKSCSVRQPGGILSNLLCPGLASVYGCSANNDSGASGAYMGVMCCRDNVAKSEAQKCGVVGVPEQRNENGDP